MPTYAPAVYTPGNDGEILRDMLFNLGVETVPSMGMGELLLQLANIAPSLRNDLQLAPANTIAQTVPRQSSTVANLSMSTGVLQLAAVYLPAGAVINNFNWLSGSTAGATLTHQWMALYTSARVLVATSADATSGAIAASTPITYAVATVAAGAATSYTVPTSGLYYVGLMVANGATQPSGSGITSTAASTGIVPILSGTSTGSLTTAPTFPTTATAITPTTGIIQMWLT